MTGIAPGTLRDIHSGVDLEAQHPFFGSPDEARSFFDAGVLPYAGRLPPAPRVVDFGGGQGLLAGHAAQRLRALGFAPETWVVDANPGFLEQAARRGLRTLACDVAQYDGPPADLALMRLALHYNPAAAQPRMLARMRACLAPRGWLVLQLETGEPAICALRNGLAAIVAGHVGEAAGHWVDAQGIVAWLREAGFGGVHTAADKTYESDLAALLRNAWSRHRTQLQARGIEEEAFLRELAQALFAWRREGGAQAVREGAGGWSIRTDCPVIVAFP